MFCEPWYRYLLQRHVVYKIWKYANVLACTRLDEWNGRSHPACPAYRRATGIHNLSTYCMPRNSWRHDTENSIEISNCRFAVVLLTVVSGVRPAGRQAEAENAGPPQTIMLSNNCFDFVIFFNLFPYCAISLKNLLRMEKPDWLQIALVRACAFRFVRYVSWGCRASFCICSNRCWNGDKIGKKGVSFTEQNNCF